jgi:hypothetical protein
MYGFGLDLYSEQGVELLYSTVGKIESRAYGINSAQSKLKFIMETHLLQISPYVIADVHRGRKRKQEQ